MLPADQGFGPDHPAGAHMDLGLVIQHQLLPGQRLLQALHVLKLTALLQVLFGVKKVITVFASLLGLVHGLVSLAQQLFSIHLLGLRKQRHPDAGRNLQRMAVNQHGRIGGTQQALQQWRACRYGFDVHQHGNKFVATQTRQGIAIT
ncbi:hypothetical protein GALL_438270 [mine drainage metagenome]|uniref:Uncharacterized protein n=1 Tax=mine drainage metagenome TaxID=410659 RepID=A0A1J5PUJ0_9ZZZZ